MSKTGKKKLPGWASFLEHIVIVEGECVEENYGRGSGANDADEKMNAATRRNYASLKAMMPVLLAAPELLAALKEMVMLRCLGGATADNDSATQRAVMAINKAEGRGE
jgi:hypothetical protein